MTESTFLTNMAIAAPARHPLSRDVAAGGYPITPQPIRDLVAAEEAITALADRERAALNETFPVMLDRVASALFAGEPLPEDLAAQAGEALATEERARVTERVIASLRSSVQGRWGVELRTHVDEMLTGLSDQLDDLLKEVRAAAAVVDTIDLTDPEMVGEATTKQREALAALKALRPRYRRLRERQENLLTQAREIPPADSGQLMWPSFFRTRVHEFSALDTFGQPADDLPAVLWFRRLLNRTDVWLPTLTQLTEAAQTNAGNARPAPRTDADPAPVFGEFNRATAAYLDAGSRNNGMGARR